MNDLALITLGRNAKCSKMRGKNVMTFNTQSLRAFANTKGGTRR